eukprot:3593295-Rhodomonas_salina.4
MSGEGERTRCGTYRPCAAAGYRVAKPAVVFEWLSPGLGLASAEHRRHWMAAIPCVHTPQIRRHQTER